MAVIRPTLWGNGLFFSVKITTKTLSKAVKSLPQFGKIPTISSRKCKPPSSPQMQSHVHYFLNMSWRGPGKNFRTVSKMLSSSSSSSSPHPAGMAFFGRVSEPSQACSMAAFSSASFSSFFFSPYYIIIRDSDHRREHSTCETLLCTTAFWMPLCALWFSLNDQQDIFIIETFLKKFTNVKSCTTPLILN